MSEPPDAAVQAAVEASRNSPCRSQRGAAIFEPGTGRVHVTGWNWRPVVRCDQSDACKATCRAAAVHAEQSALLARRVPLRSDLLHAKTVGGVLVPSGPPSCVECSKLIYAAAILGVWLYHASGWRYYEAADFHLRSLDHQRTTDV